MKNLYLIIFLNLFVVKGYSQDTLVLNIPQPEIVEGKEQFNKFMQKARNSFQVENYGMCYSYLKEAESEGHATAEFYFYIGVTSYYHKKNVEAARRYLSRGISKFSSKECEDALKKINEANP